MGNVQVISILSDERKRLEKVIGEASNQLLIDHAETSLANIDAALRCCGVDPDAEGVPELSAA